MENEQAFDVVDTPPPEWPSLQDFSSFEIRRYRDIDIGCFRLLGTFDHGVNKYGASLVLKLENTKGDVFSVWAPSSLACALKMRENTRFIWNHGLVKNNNKEFFSFSLC